MTLVATNPWRLMQQWQTELDSARHQSAGADKTLVEGANWIPAVDIREEDDKYLLHADVSGVKPQDIEIAADKGVLSIKGERKQESIENKESYKRIERSFGMFHRRFTLPDDADAEKITATGRDGVIAVVIPKMEAQKPRKIEVQG